MNAMRIRVLLPSVMMVFCGLSFGATLQFLDATRLVSAAWGSADELQSPASKFGEFDEEVLIESESWLIGEAFQKSAFGERVISANLRASADTHFLDPGPGWGRSHLVLSFQVNEAVDFKLHGGVGGYDGTGTFSLSEVLSASATTVWEDDEGFLFSTPGGRLFETEGTLQPGEYTLRAEGRSQPELGGHGEGTAAFTLEFVAKTLPQWFELRGLPEDSDLNSDHDRDGVPLILEYALRLDPAVADVAESALRFALNSNTGAAELIYPAERGSVSYHPEWSTDGVNWSGEGIVKTRADGEVIASYGDPPSRGAFLMRLRVELL